MRFKQIVCGVVMAALLSSSTCCSASIVHGKSDSRGGHAMLEQKMSAPMVEKYLVSGKLAEGDTALSAELQLHPHDDQVRFGLGMLQFLRAIEKLSQDLYHYGLRGFSSRGGPFAFARIPVPDNPDAEELTYPKAREVAKTFIANLAKAESTLVQVSDPDVKLPLHFGMIRMDLRGDGRIDDSEMLWKVYAAVNMGGYIDPDKAANFFIKFDRGDVHWLRGYCHLLMAISEVYLAYDTKETFDRTAQLFFSKVKSPYPFLNKTETSGSQRDINDILDVVALIHTIRWEVVEPDRMQSALHHLEACVAQSKQSWKWIMAETGDDHEWIPNPRQTGVIPGVKVTDEMVSTWLTMVDELEKILKGELLVPFWRGDHKLGVNVRKVFTQPTTFDFVLWVQGSAAGPYLETGNMSHETTWRKINQVFGHNFPGFAIWFN